MAAFSNYLELAVLDYLFGAGANDLAPATYYLALFTAAPTDAGGGTEVSGGSYVRKAVTNNATNFPAAALVGDLATKLLDVEQLFVTATANWGTITHFAVFDASSGGNMRGWGALAASKVINTGDAFRFPAATGLTITLD